MNEVHESGFRHAIVCPPDIALALEQHRAYCRALEACGLEVTVLPPDQGHADSCFVEDTAVLAGELAVVSRPGAASRRGETAAISGALASRFRRLDFIAAPATLDGGDVCRAGRLFFIGLSRRTNEAGGRQLADFLAGAGFDSRFVPLADDNAVLHLKSGLAWLGGTRLVVIRPWLKRPEFKGFDLLPVDADESYGANCLLVNGKLLLARGHPCLRASLERLKYEVVELDMSEFRKMDGGLSCLSLRY